MQKRPVVAAAFHEEKFNKLILVLFKTDGKIDEFFLDVVKEKSEEFLYFAANISQQNSKLMRRSFMHTQIPGATHSKGSYWFHLGLENGTALVSGTDSNKFLGISQILRPES